MLKAITILSALAVLPIAGCGGQNDASSGGISPEQEQNSGPAADNADTPDVVGAVSGAEASQIADDYLEILSKFAAAIEGVTDEPSAQEAAETIAGLNDDMTSLADAFEELTAVQKSAMYIEHAQDFLSEQTRLADALTRVATENPELIEALQTEFEKMPALEN
ncbi:MAG: hypothetical protein AAGC77_07240 [Pseudomonadota bacterium]